MMNYREYLKEHTIEELKEYHGELKKQRWKRMIFYLIMPAYIGVFMSYFMVSQDMTTLYAYQIHYLMIGATLGSIFTGMLCDPLLEVAHVTRKKMKEREESIVLMAIAHRTGENEREEEIISEGEQ